MSSSCAGYQEVYTIPGCSRFMLQTNHKPLRCLKDAEYQIDRVFWWAVAVQEYFFRVEDIPGKENILADFLRRTGYSC